MSAGRRLEKDTVMKGQAQARSILKLPRKSAGPAAHGTSTTSPAAPPASTRTPPTLDDGLRRVLERFLWPMTERAFQNVEDQVEARFFQLEDLQVVISRAPARSANPPEKGRRVTLELWPGAGPRLLVVEWSGRRPYVVHRRDGDWLERLIRLAQHPG